MNCSNCGAPVDVAHTLRLRPLRLAAVDARPAARRRRSWRSCRKPTPASAQPIDPALPLELCAPGAQTEAAFPDDRGIDWSATDLVEAGLQAVASWLKRNA